jgi:hypothetical protein
MLNLIVIPGQAEVDDLQSAVCRRRLEDEVLWFKVSMRDIVHVMDVADGAQHAPD